jgi:DNA-binding NarL/FixJ family response regulator
MRSRRPARVLQKTAAIMNIKADGKLEIKSRLAPREAEVLHLLAKGRPYKQIADELELSIGTVRTYIRRLYGKLNVNCRTDAVVKYLTVL